VAMPSAKAADLGGDCCADLEERVAELEATTARKGNRRVSLTVSGQVNRAVMFWDDQRDTGLYSVDNSVSRSGFQFDGTAKINPNLTAGFQLVIGLALGARSHHVRQDDDDGFSAPPTAPGGASGPTTGFGGGDGTLGVELANWFLRHDQLGELRVGRLNTASAGTTVVDLGGAGVIANAHIGLWNANFGSGIGPGVGGSWNTLMGGNLVSINGLSRADGVSYTTPTLAGFSLQAAFAEGYGSSFQQGEWDIAARYAGEFAGFRLAAAAAYCWNCGFVGDVSDNQGAAFFTPVTESADVTKIQGSASILHVASGLYLTGALGRVSYDGPTNGEIGRPDTTFWYVQGGISKNWTGLGNTVLYGEYSRVNDGFTCFVASCAASFGGNAGDIVDSSQVDVWGIGIVQHIDAAAMELYLAYRNYGASLHSPEANNLVGTINANDLSIVMGGARIRF
jgi:hypothetical protein